MPSKLLKCVFEEGIEMIAGSAWHSIFGTNHGSLLNGNKSVMFETSALAVISSSCISNILAGM